MSKYLLFNISKKEKLNLIILFLIIFASSFFSMYPIVLINKIIDMSIDYRFITYDIVIKSLLYICFQLFGCLLSSMVNYIATNIKSRISYNLKTNLHIVFMETKLSELKKNNYFSVSANIIQDTEFISENTVSILTSVFTAIFQFAIGLYYMISISISLTLIIIPFGFITSLLIKNIRNKSLDNIRSEKNKTSKLWETFNEGILGAITIRFNRYERQYSEKVVSSSLNILEIQKKQSKLESATLFIMKSSFMLTIGLILLIASTFVKNGVISIGALTAILMYNHMLTDPLITFQSNIQQYRKLKISLDRINMIYMMPKENRNRITEKIENITIDNIKFGFDNSHENIISKFSINIDKGKSLGVYGSTGSGKSTLVNLISGIYIPYEGNILYNKKLNSRKWIPSIAYMTQDDYIFNSTIKENIFYMANCQVKCNVFE